MIDCVSIRRGSSAHSGGAVLRWIGLALGVALLGLFAPGSTLAQPEPVQSVLEQGRAVGMDAELLRSVATRGEQNGLTPKETASLLRPAVALATDDLPATPLLNKTLEGLAKQVPVNRLTPVLDRMQGHVQQAGALASEWLGRSDVQDLVGASDEAPPPAERARLITNLADARRQNVSQEHLRAFLDNLPSATDRRPVPLAEVSTAVGVMPDLPGIQDNPDTAQQLLTAAINAGYDPESMRQLPVALASARRESQRPPIALARDAAQAISRGTPAANVLKGLFRGGVPGAGAPVDVGEGSPETPPGQGKPPGKGGNPPKGPPDEPPGGGPPGGGPPDEPPGGGSGG